MVATQDSHRIIAAAVCMFCSLLLSHSLSLVLTQIQGNPRGVLPVAIEAKSELGDQEFRWRQRSLPRQKRAACEDSGMCR